MLTNIAEKLGILDVVAPWIGNDDGHPNGPGAAHRTTNPHNSSDFGARTQRNTSKRGLDKTHTSSSASENVTTTTTNPSRCKNAKTLGNVESEQGQREKRRITMLTAQKEEEDRSRKIGQFAKKQRVSYHHRGTNKEYDAFIVGVHLDDGPDKPYYTIKYNQTEYFMNDSGMEEKKEVAVEKQTNPDRLTALPWDEAKTWELIGN